MLYTILLTILVLDALLLVTAVLLQAGTGGGMASLGGGGSPTESFMGGRQAVTVLTKMSWWCGGIFLGLSLVLAGMSSSAGAPTSVLETPSNLAPTPVAPLPLDGGGLPGGLSAPDQGTGAGEPAAPAEDPPQ